MEADKPSVEGLMEVARQYAHCYFNTGNGNVTHEPLSAFEGRLQAYARRLASAAAPAAQPATPLRNALFEAGWRLAARWSHREDLYADTGSAAYVRDRDAVLAEFDRLLAEKT